ncbi:MAG TPA: TonB-dependent siderophore receptor [Vicinamibacterales bacterium]|jgi:catecholate siderophore receptor|nr:TonB-dependent siderophore receptor [Vicinamibacterales bacterium]
MLRRAILLACSLCLAGSSPGLAQPPSPATPNAASLDGTVVDPSGAPISRAEVVVTSLAGTTLAKTVSALDGTFHLSLPPGECTVTALASGFDAVSRTVAVEFGHAATVSMQLTVAGVRESVSVAAAARGYDPPATTTATKTATPLRDTPQTITVVTRQLIDDQMMSSIADAVRYVPGIAAHQGENNRDQVVIRGNSSSADFFVDGVRDDVQYYRDLYNIERLEALKGPNAMIFGRGGGGGVINRVRKSAVFAPVRELSLSAGSFGRKRATADVGGALGHTAAVRLNAMYEDADSFRDGVGMRRYGVNPTATFRFRGTAMLTAGFEHVSDHRTADRGISSFASRPLAVDVSTYFGNPSETYVRSRADLFSAAFEQRFGGWTVRDHAQAAGYDRGYQNFVPGVVNADETAVTLTAYNNHTSRVNVFNQTDLTGRVQTGSIRHLLMAGAEFGRQLTDNLRNTGYFAGGATSALVPRSNPRVAVPVVFRQSASDADNHVRAVVSAGYVQDQVDVTRFVQLVGGMRVDSFAVQLHNNRTTLETSRTDVLVSPRAGILVKPVPPLSLYGSYTVSYLPSAGDQFSALTAVTEQLKPERFTNYEAGVKWEVTPGLDFSGAVYQLDRTNTRSTDPLDAARIVQTGSQRTNGVETGLMGRITSRWQIAAGYAWQDAFVTSATAAARTGARAPQVPRHSASLWNLYQIERRLAFAAGVVHRSDVFAAIDNTVVLPGFTTVDAAAYLDVTARARLQVNVENVFDARYYANADNNTNISPGWPRAARIALVTKF